MKICLWHHPFCLCIWKPCVCISPLTSERWVSGSRGEGSVQYQKNIYVTYMWHDTRRQEWSSERSQAVTAIYRQRLGNYVFELLGFYLVRLTGNPRSRPSQSIGRTSHRPYKHSWFRVPRDTDHISQSQIWHWPEASPIKGRWSSPTQWLLVSSPVWIHRLIHLRFKNLYVIGNGASCSRRERDSLHEYVSHLLHCSVARVCTHSRSVYLRTCVQYGQYTRFTTMNNACAGYTQSICERKPWQQNIRQLILALRNVSYMPDHCQD
jgi:hypothetical protein